MRIQRILILASITALLSFSCSDEDDPVTPDKGTPDVGVKDGAGTDATAGDAGSTAPLISLIIPADGLANGGSTGKGTPVLITGKNFSQGMTLYIDGQPQALVISVASSVAMTFVIPKNEYGNTVRVVNIMVFINGEFSNTKSFTYTVTKAMTADLKGSIITKTGESYADYPSPTAYEGKVYVKDVTDKETKVSTKIKADIGYGKQDSKTGKCPDPSIDSGWAWYPATWSKADSTTGYHHYTGNPKVGLSLTYCVTYRFSYDPKGNGQFGEYIYTDLDEADLKFDVTKTATIKATAAPMDYCLKSADCYDSRKVVCKLSSSWKSHKCVQCLASTDCVPNKNSFGNLCKTTTNSCYCSADADCKEKLLGYVCANKASSGSFCGCKKDTNCPVGLKCLKTQSGATICGTPSP